MNKTINARKTENKKYQTLKCHNKNVADISSVFSCYPHISRLLAYLHDMGKMSRAFQDYLENDEKNKTIIHSSD